MDIQKCIAEENHNTLDAKETTLQLTMKEKIDLKTCAVKCVLCEGNPVNYKRYIVYKNLRKLKYPPLRYKQPVMNLTKK